MKKVPKTITFHYTNSVPLKDIALRVRIYTPFTKTSNASTIVLFIILGLIGAIFLYGFCNALFFCIRRSYSHRNLRRREQEWINNTQTRYNKILKSTAESKFEPKSVKYEQFSCSICLSEFENGCGLRKLACSHIFHKGCIDEWIRARILDIPRCPTCNLELSKEKPPANASLINYVRERMGIEMQNIVHTEENLNRQNEQDGVNRVRNVV